MPSGVLRNSGPRAFYAQGRHWLLVGDTEIQLISSPDGTQWSPPETLLDGLTTPRNTTSMVAAGSHVHVVISKVIIGEPVLYRRGLLSSDGSVAWSNTQVAVPASTTRAWRHPSVGVDTLGHVAIFYHETGTAGFYGCWATVSSATDGTWKTDPGFPMTLNGKWGGWVGLPVALSNGEMYFVHQGPPLYNVHSRAYSAGTLGPDEPISSNTPTANPSVAFGEELNVMTADWSSDSLAHFQRRKGSWRRLTDVETNTRSRPIPAIVDSASGTLGVAWADNGRIMVRMGARQSDGTYVWGPSSLCYDASALVLGGHFHAYGTNGDQRLWVVFTTGEAAPYSVRVTSCGSS